MDRDKLWFFRMLDEIDVHDGERKRTVKGDGVGDHGWKDLLVNWFKFYI